MTYYPATGRCTVCGGEAEIEYDAETGSPYTVRCRPCAKAVTATPYCHRGDCPRQACGTMTRITNGRAVGKGARAVYACPRCGYEGTAVHWAVQSAYQSATRDVARAEAGDLDLTGVRAKSAHQSANYDHPVTRAGGRAYLLGLRHARS